MKMTAKATVAALCVLLAAAHARATDIAVIGGLTREAVVQPGEETEGKIIIANSATEPRNVRMYKTDYMYTAEGNSTYGDPGTAARSNAPWITFSPDRLEIPPEGDASLYYTIRVPDGEELTGTYWSILMVELISADSPEMVPADDSEDKPIIGVRTVMRYGVQMITEIGDTGERAVKFAAKRLVEEEANRVLEVDVENVGERRLSPTVWADLYDADGVSIGRFEALRLRIHPGCSTRYHINLRGVPNGTYNALIVVDNGDEHVFGTQAELVIG